MYVYIYIDLYTYTHVCCAASHPLKVVYSVFIRRKAKTTGHSEVFEVQVANNSTIYPIFDFTVFLHSERQKPPLVAMFLSWLWPKTPLFRFRVCLNTLSKSTAICEVFLQFRAKPSSLGSVQEHCKNQCFCPTKRQKPSPKSQKLPPRPPDKTHLKNKRLKTENRRAKVKNTQVFSLLSCRFRAGACTSMSIPYCNKQCFLRSKIATY